MSRKTSYPPRKADVLLGLKIKKLRVKLEMSQMQLGRVVNERCQQIDRYETGALVPLAHLEDIAKALGAPIPKKIIRRISIERKIQTETGIERKEELTELYNEAFPEEDDEEEDGDEEKEEE